MCDWPRLQGSAAEASRLRIATAVAAAAAIALGPPQPPTIDPDRPGAPAAPLPWAGGPAHAAAGLTELRGYPSAGSLAGLSACTHAAAPLGRSADGYGAPAGLPTLDVRRAYSTDWSLPAPAAAAAAGVAAAAGGAAWDARLPQLSETAAAAVARARLPAAAHDEAAARFQARHQPQLVRGIAS